MYGGGTLLGLGGQGQGPRARARVRVRVRVRVSGGGVLAHMLRNRSSVSSVSITPSSYLVRVRAVG